MRLRITKVDEYQFLTCLKHSLWGSRSARFKDWQKGDKLAFIVDKALAGYAEVYGEPFRSGERVWDNGLFPWRIPIKFQYILTKDKRIPILGEIRDVLMSAWGNSYGWGILNQRILSDSPAEKIIGAFAERPNNLDKTKSDIEPLLCEAKQQREVSPEKKTARRISLKTQTEPALEISIPEEEDSAHSKAQNALIKLGKITGCSVWIASNDKNRSFRGKILGTTALNNCQALA